jgi:hypothetical protein
VAGSHSRLAGGSRRWSQCADCSTAGVESARDQPPMLCRPAAALPQVCPANWKPGDKTIVADPERSLEYFEAANKVRARSMHMHMHMHTHTHRHGRQLARMRGAVAGLYCRGC